MDLDSSRSDWWKPLQLQLQQDFNEQTYAYSGTSSNPLVLWAADFVELRLNDLHKFRFNVGLVGLTKYHSVEVDFTARVG